ncbi:MAG: c-type cytochrome [Planctomycetes bacterium]|nr:c-type cytochrome [Planctomycetota bacterium]
MLRIPRPVALLLGGALLCAAACSSTSSTSLMVESAPIDGATRAQVQARMSRLRCVACHAAQPAVQSRLRPEAAPDLAGIGARKSPAALRAWLLDPRAEKPHSAMPDLLAGLAARERVATAGDLVQYLASLGGPLDARATAVDVSELERGRQLFHSVGCIACHAAEEDADSLAEPLWTGGLEQGLVSNPDSDLKQLRAATTVDALARFLLDPLAARPSGRMPSLRLSGSEARSIAAYLLRSQARSGDSLAAPGLLCELYEGRFDSAAIDLEGRSASATSVLEDLSQLPSQHPEDDFALVLRGFVRVDAPGRYEFSTLSDDGSMLYVDGKLVVSNDGIHPAVEASGALTLEPGLHGLRITYFEAAGGEELSVRWQPPGGKKEVLPAAVLSHSSLSFVAPSEPFVADAQQAARGRGAFTKLGCAACHTLGNQPVVQPAARPFAELAAGVERGCLAERPDPRSPHFDLTPEQRAQLRGVTRDLAALAAPRTQQEELRATLARLDCLACHSRDGEGGPNEQKLPYFRTSVEVDLGNEGRLPPHLDAVGSKLYPAAISKVLLEGAVERPYIATRMPQYGAANVGELGALFEHVDGSPKDLVAPAFSSASAETGRKLAGTGGLGCIQCHAFDGTKSLGIPAVDLAHVRERIKPGWFRQLLLDPKSLGMNTRMPIFWDAQGKSAARTILDGDPKQQADALWSYVSLGRSMPLPDGLVVADSEYELVPTTEAILCGVFLKNTSPRALLVGNPELVHYAFDLENSHLVCAWRGRFFNARGTWEGRAGGLEWPKSDELLEFEQAPTLAFLSSSDAPWPEQMGRAAGFKRLGTRYDAQRRPTFRYRVRDVEIAESCVPLVRQGTLGLTRRFELRSPKPIEDLYLRASPGSTLHTHVSFSREADGAYVAHAEVEVTW